MGFDWVWLLSVWRTGPAGQHVSRTNAEWRKEFEATLPDLREEDIAGSGFAITAARHVRHRLCRPLVSLPQGTCALKLNLVGASC